MDDPDEALSVYVEAMKVAHEGTEEEKKDLLDEVVERIKEPFEFLSNLMESARWDDAGVLLLPVAVEACRLFLKEKEQK